MKNILNFSNFINESFKTISSDGNIETMEWISPKGTNYLLTLETIVDMENHNEFFGKGTLYDERQMVYVEGYKSLAATEVSKDLCDIRWFSEEENRYSLISLGTGRTFQVHINSVPKLMKKVIKIVKNEIKV